MQCKYSSVQSRCYTNVIAKRRTTDFTDYTDDADWFCKLDDLRMGKIVSDNRWQSVVMLFFFLLFTATSSSSQTESQNPTFGDSMKELISFFAPFVFPKVIQDGYQLKEYIRNEEFASIRSQRGDLNAVDAIFSEAMRLSWNNVYEALLISLVATMDHSKFGVKLPVVGPLLWFPLTSEFEEDFRERVAALPRLLYSDSPDKAIGDRDKLQHFFGSAFLTYALESRDGAQRVGEFIEWGEDKVIVDGALDERDFRANNHGQEFGLALLNDKGMKPSAFIMYTIAQEFSVRDTTEVGTK
jgi:hypothetical protein